MAREHYECGQIELNKRYYKGDFLWPKRGLERQGYDGVCMWKKKRKGKTVTKIMREQLRQQDIILSHLVRNKYLSDLLILITHFTSRHLRVGAQTIGSLLRDVRFRNICFR